MPQSAVTPTSVATKRSRLRHPLLLVAGIMLVAANLRAALTSVGPLLEQIQQQLMLSATSAGLLNSLPLILFAVLSPVTPGLAKRIGIERTLGVALLLLVIGIVLRSMPQTGMLWLGSILIGAAIAFANVVLPTLVKRDFPSRAAAMIAAYAAVMSLVAATASGLAVPLAALNNLGWRFSLLCWSLPALLALIVWLPQLRRSPALTASHALQTQPVSARSPWRSALGWQVALFMGLQSITFYTIIGWFSAFAASHGTSPQQAGFELFIYQVVAIAANFVMVFILPRARDQRAIALCSSLLIFIGVAGLLLLPGYSLVWLIFAGLGAGSSLVLALSFFGLRSSHHHQATQLSGMAQSVGYLLAALGPTLFGLLHDLTQGWRLPLMVLLCLTLLQMLFGMLAGRNRVIR
ncbi:MFS transporter [Serratia liquefaciens]|jgi:CP family cyanate transporter-like MFS transporter|uniref:CynX/NimT family MFS transporter n=1 Tax=Serratia liquefaciens TaxID=614 RepID=UPI000D509A27|nr:MFS transporter [Serratia liquefaciens]PVD39873.1 MFS transporter [Serratia liquefaciens]QHT52550.1 MFS transporter [Serratia liquefaciens]